MQVQIFQNTVFTALGVAQLRLCNRQKIYRLIAGEYQLFKILLPLFLCLDICLGIPLYAQTGWVMGVFRNSANEHSVFIQTAVTVSMYTATTVPGAFFLGCGLFHRVTQLVVFVLRNLADQYCCLYLREASLLMLVGDHLGLGADQHLLSIIAFRGMRVQFPFLLAADGFRHLFIAGICVGMSCGLF